METQPRENPTQPKQEPTQPREEPGKNKSGLDLEALSFYQEKLADVTDAEVVAFPARFLDEELRNAFLESSDETKRQIVFLVGLTPAEFTDIKAIVRSNGYLPGLHQLINVIQAVNFYREEGILTSQTPEPKP